MNSERQLDNNGRSIALFRSMFQAIVARLSKSGLDIDYIEQNVFLKAAREVRADRNWYFENDGITEHDASLYETVMLDYLNDLLDCLKNQQGDIPIESCMRELFY